MTDLSNSTPRMTFQGFDDQSVPPLLPIAEALPFNLPYFFIYGQTGRTEGQLVMPGDQVRLYGAETFNERSKYYNHSTHCLLAALNNGNPCFVQRVVTQCELDQNTIINIPRKSNAVLAVRTFEYVGSDPALGVVKAYDRYTQNDVALDNTKVLGAVKLDVNGAPIELNTYIAGGIKVQTVILPMYDIFWDDVNQIFNWNPVESTDSVTNIKTTTYPIQMLEHSHFGKTGDSVGFKLWPAVPGLANSYDSDIVVNQEALVYNFQVLTKDNEGYVKAVPDLNGGNIQTFCYKPNAFNFKTDENLNLEKIFNAYKDDGILSGVSPTDPPIGKTELLAATTGVLNIETLLTKLLAAEKVAMLAWATTNAPIPENLSTIEIENPYDVNYVAGVTQSDIDILNPSIYLVDFLMGKRYDGIDAYGFRVINDATTNAFGPNRAQWLLEGSDGVVTLTAFHAAVERILASATTDMTTPILDQALFPSFNYRDSGYPISVKKRFIDKLADRQDIWVGLTTYEDGIPPRTISEELSVLASLRLYAQLYPESVLHGTGVTRCTISMQSGEGFNPRYNKRIPQEYDLIVKDALYMGGGTGGLIAGRGYDKDPDNIITELKNLSAPYIPMTAKEKLWMNGAIYSQANDMKHMFYPGIQTIYERKRSVLCSKINMVICCNLLRHAHTVWKRISGRSDLTPAELVVLSDRIFNEQINGRYDGRCIVTPNSQVTAIDDNNGYSWTLKINAAFNMMELVENVDLVVTRIKAGV